MREKVIFLSFISNVSKNGALRFPSRQKTGSRLVLQSQSVCFRKTGSENQKSIFLFTNRTFKVSPPMDDDRQMIHPITCVLLFGSSDSSRCVGLEASIDKWR